jgi:hypothetical protein
MIIKEITFPSGRTVTQLQPDLGYKYITNNEVWSNLVILGYKDKIENWHDTNEEPPIEENDIPIEEKE